MKLYAVEDEVRIALARRVRDWAKAGLLAADQATDLQRDLTTGLKRSGLVLRLGLALFTVIAGTAAVGLVVLMTNLQSQVTAALMCAVLGAGAFTAATFFARDFKWYRHGVEEASAVGSVALFGAAVGLLGTSIFSSRFETAAWVAVMGTVAVASVRVYQRFGLQYAAVAAMCAAALLPAAFSSVDVEVKRLFAALVCAGTAALTTTRRGAATDDVARRDAEVIRAAAVAGVYLALNIHILVEPFGRTAPRWYAWVSWGLVWLLPIVAGRVATLQRDSLLLRVAMAAGLATLLTNKSYLGWPRQPWDPMLLGVLLIAVALALRRWLTTGVDGERNGFTARQLVESEGATIQMVSLASVAAQPGSGRHPHEPADTSFSGGRSGGGGGGSAF